VGGLDDLAELVVDRVAEGGGPVDLVAQSMGGVVAVLVAVRRPELVRRLVLTATSGGIDLAPFGVADWRSDYRQAYPSATWITDARVDLTDRLGTVRAPTLLLWTDADPISPVGVGERLAELLPDARLVVIPGGDHMFARDRAADVAPRIAAHLGASCESRGARGE
jgi:pimeloyl-ACP methyl ester carboxylesterase